MGNPLLLEDLLAGSSNVRVTDPLGYVELTALLVGARAVLTETLQRMEADCRQPGPEQPRRGQIWEMFCVRLLEPIFNGTEPPAYDQLIERFALKSPTDASNTLLSAKRIFKAHLGRVIKEYAGQDAAAAVEIQALEDFLGRLAKRG